MKAHEICHVAQHLLSGARSETHGPKRRNHENIAALWNSYLGIRRDPAAPLTPQDVTHMMALLKIARTQLGCGNIDDHVDGAAYFAIAGELTDD